MKEEKLTLSLTGKDSHEFILEPGRGDFNIGTKGLSKGEYDVLIEKEDTINWDTLNYHYNPLFKEQVKCPYGFWPRWVKYSGNDTGWIDWCKKRALEEFEWFPQKDMTVHLEDANISTLTIHSNYRIILFIKDKVNYLKLDGNLENYQIAKCEQVPALSFNFQKSKTKQKSYRLPDFPTLHLAIDVTIWNDVNQKPFDCTSLLQFSNLENIALIGNVENLDALQNLKNLKKIGLWNIPNLSGMPNLNDFKYLTKVIAVNIEEKGGKKLRRELIKIKKTKKLEYSSVCKLRNRTWFEIQASNYFSEWSNQNEKKALAAYQVCLQKVKNAKEVAEVKSAMVEFITQIKQLRNIETPEWDDVYLALCNLMEKSSLPVNSKTWLDWFYETKDEESNSVNLSKR